MKCASVNLAFGEAQAELYQPTGFKESLVRFGLDRVLTWPPERQADVAHMLELMEEQDNSVLRLSDEQLAEVRRRRAKTNPIYDAALYVVSVA